MCVRIKKYFISNISDIYITIMQYLRDLFLLDWLPLKVKIPSLPCYLIYSGDEKRQIHTFPKGISVKENVTD